MNLFRLGNFKLSGGQSSTWKIDCDALNSWDWMALATMAADFLPRFRAVEGVPRGGLPFAGWLRNFTTDAPGDPLLIADDVLTTGASMEQLRAGREAIGVVVFARGPCPAWVTPLFQMPQR